MATREELIKMAEADEWKAAHARLATWSGERIAKLEAALREIMEFTAAAEDDDPISNCYVLAREALED